MLYNFLVVKLSNFSLELAFCDLSYIVSCFYLKQDIIDDQGSNGLWSTIMLYGMFVSDIKNKKYYKTTTRRKCGSITLSIHKKKLSIHTTLQTLQTSITNETVLYVLHIIWCLNIYLFDAIASLKDGDLKVRKVRQND